MLAEKEIEVQHNIIERQRLMHNKLFVELSSLKTVVEVPKLRDMMPRVNKHGMNYNQFTK